MNIKDDWQVRLCYKRASSRFENGNCDHKKDPFVLQNTVNLIHLRRPLTSSIVSRKPLNVSMVLKRPLEIFNGFWGDHHHWMFFCSLTIAINGFSMVFGLATIAFNGFRWFWTIGQTMRWFRWIVVVYCKWYGTTDHFILISIKRYIYFCFGSQRSCYCKGI